MIGKMSPGCWPTGAVADLVRAAALEPEPALHAWFRCRADLDRLRPVCERLFAAVYANLGSVSDDHLLLGLRDHHRDAWLKNERLMRRATLVIERFREAHITVLVLKGAALTVLYYRDLGARPMGDIDLLVGPERARDAVEILQRAGWQEVIADASPTGPLKYGFHVEHGSGDTLDLHEYSLAQSADDTDFWTAAIPLELNGTSALALHPSDQLLHVCVHGLRWLPKGSMTWIVDAMKVLRAEEENLDWDRLVERAQGRLLTVALADALGHLREHYGADVPAEVIDRLRATPSQPFQHAAHRALMRPPNTIRFIVATWDRYRRFSLLAAPERRPVGFGDFLRRGWGLDSRAQLARHAVGKVVKRNYRDLK